MSQRDSGYARVERDAYETPEWVTKVLGPHLGSHITSTYEPAAGSGKMSSVLRQLGLMVEETDISKGNNFLDCRYAPCQSIITNPPYVLAQEFIEHALGLTQPINGVVAMLLRTDYDHAKTRRHLFGQHKAFAKKIVLTKRIQWFEDSHSAPSFNHAWFIWDWQHEGPPTLAYGPN